MPEKPKPPTRKRPPGGAPNVERVPMTPLRTLGNDVRETSATRPA
ncbi:MAG TPA: hypothetical protein VM600_06160 [Actinomycetota bacterium]|nr:hypothetical protein [Actinomycetota bacterium]